MNNQDALFDKQKHRTGKSILSFDEELPYAEDDPEIEALERNQGESIREEDSLAKKITQSSLNYVLQSRDELQNQDTSSDLNDIGQIFGEQDQLHERMKQLKDKYGGKSVASLRKRSIDIKRRILHQKTYNMEATGSNSSEIYKWLAQCVKYSRQLQEYNQAIIYVDRLIEKCITDFGPSSYQTGIARMEKVKLLTTLQQWTDALSEIIQILQSRTGREKLSLSRDRFTSLYLAELASRNMPSSFRIPWAPRIDITNVKELDDLPKAPEDGLQYFPPLDQWYSIILDHLKFVIKEVGFQQYKPYILKNAAWLISRQSAQLNSHPDTLFEQLEPSAYVDIVNKKTGSLPSTVKKDIRHSIKYNENISLYFQKKKMESSMIGDIQYSIALAYYRIGELKESIKTCQNVIKLYHESGSADLDIARACHLLALCLKDIDQAQAIKLVESSLDIIEKLEVTQNIEYLQFLYTYFVLSSKEATPEQSNLYHNRMAHALNLSKEIDEYNISDYFLRLPIAIFEWNDFTASPELIAKAFETLAKEQSKTQAG